MAITTVLFDLDGTIIDSSTGIRRCADESLLHHGLPAITDEQFAHFIGPPLTVGFGSVCPDDAMIDSLVTVYREHYGAGGMYEYSVYDGVPELLQRLRARNLRLAVATSKVQRFARPVVDHAGLTAEFEVVIGAERDGAGAAQPVVMDSALRYLGITDPGSVVMIGDREHDGHGASALGTGFVGVTWGFGTEAELRSAGAHHVVVHPSEIDGVIAAM